MTAAPKLKAPFPYFGGKRSVAELVWSRLGDVDNAIEPFCGSAIWLLSRPSSPRIETVNDADCYVSNFWRATSVAPELVAAAADWPVDEADLHARHRWLVLSEEAAAFRSRMRSDPEYFDARIAGWWCWGLCCWIGGGWCVAPDDTDERRPCLSRAGANGGVASIEDSLPVKMPNIAGQANEHGRRNHLGRGVNGSADHSKRPVIASPNGSGNGGEGRGVHGKALKQSLPSIAGDCGASGRGVHASAMNGYSPVDWAQKPQLANWNDQHIHGRVNEGARPQLADAFSRGRGVNSNDSAGTCDERRAWLLDWFGRLRDRLRTVRVCCGDWRRVCDSPSVTTRLGLTGIFLDPPYAHDLKRMAAWIKHLDGRGKEPRSATGATSRDGSLYSNDRTQDVDRLVADVHRYCRERGADPKLRIALCGYEGEHHGLVKLGWTEVAWKAQGGYGNRSAGGQENAARERIWFSPHCLDPEAVCGPLFAGVPTKSRGRRK
jgi:hypothetical protein